MVEEVEEYDVTGAIRIGLDVALTLASLYILWVYMRDQPEITILQRKLVQWWERVRTEPRRLHKMENETVFEAIQVVDHAGD